MKLITAFLIVCSASLLLATVSARDGMVATSKPSVDGKFGQSFTCSRFRPCPGNLCCSIWGHCGTGEAWCSPDTCQSNCWSSVKAVTAEEGTSGKELAKSAIDGKFGQSFRCSRIIPCPGNLCCSIWGHCGTGEAWCSPDTCQSNCWPSVKAVTAE